MQDLVWQWTRFDGLSVAELYAILAAREEVFVVEQNCVYLDCDGLDQNSFHLIGWVVSDEKRDVGAYLRVVDEGFKYKEPSIGRVLTTKVVRGTGLGKELTRQALKNINVSYPGKDIRISAQKHLASFYNFFGFKVISEPYDEDGIPHIEMMLEHENL